MIKKDDRARIVFHLLEISNLLKKHGDVITQEAGITTQQWLVLLHLAGDPNIPYFDRDEHKQPMLASELADALYVSRPNITNLINALLQKGLIKQVEDAIDRRRKRLTLAPAGKALLSKLEEGRGAFNRRLLQGLDANQEEAFLRFLETCNSTILDHFGELVDK